MPVEEWPVICEAWFGNLDLVSVPSYRTELREDQQVDKRIRVLFTPEATEARAVRIGEAFYSIERLFIGTDQESGMRIMDLSLRRWVDG